MKVFLEGFDSLEDNARIEHEREDLDKYGDMLVDAMRHFARTRNGNMFVVARAISAGHLKLEYANAERTFWCVVSALPGLTEQEALDAWLVINRCGKP